jgi:hypothetical protein
MSQMLRINTSPSERTLRQFGVLALIVFGSLAALAWTRHAIFGLHLGEARQLTVIALIVVSLFSLGCSVVYPGGNRALFIALQALGHPIGLVVSYLLLALLFFAVLGPTALLLRIIRRRPITLGFDRAAPSYWGAPRRRASKDCYFRQY